MRLQRLRVKPQQVVGDDLGKIAHKPLEVHRSLKGQWRRLECMV
jgi:hypothetical protein